MAHIPSDKLIIGKPGSSERKVIQTGDVSLGLPETQGEQGQILSSQGDGNLRWEFPHRQVNGFINSGFQVHQRWSERQVTRGINMAGLGSRYQNNQPVHLTRHFIADRWKLYTDEWDQATGYIGTLTTNSNGNRAIRLTVNRRPRQTQGWGSFIYIFEKQDLVKYVNKEIIISFRIKTNKTGLIELRTIRYNGTGAESGQALTSYTVNENEINQEIFLTHTFTVHPESIETGAVSRFARGLQFAINFSSRGNEEFINPSEIGDYIEFSEPMFNEGSSPQPYAPRFSSYAEELRACQRYYWATNNIELFGTFSDRTFQGIVNFPVEMRAIPNLEWPGLKHFFATQKNGSIENSDNPVFFSQKPTSARFEFLSALSSPIAGSYGPRAEDRIIPGFIRSDGGGTLSADSEL